MLPPFPSKKTKITKITYITRSSRSRGQGKCVKLKMHCKIRGNAIGIFCFLFEKPVRRQRKNVENFKIMIHFYFDFVVPRFFMSLWKKYTWFFEDNFFIFIFFTVLLTSADFSFQ